MTPLSNARMYRHNRSRKKKRDEKTKTTCFLFLPLPTGIQHRLYSTSRGRRTLSLKANSLASSQEENCHQFPHLECWTPEESNPLSTPLLYSLERLQCLNYVRYAPPSNGASLSKSCHYANQIDLPTRPPRPMMDT